MVLPTSSHRRVGLLAGICWTKSQFPHGGGGGGVTKWWQKTVLGYSISFRAANIYLVTPTECKPLALKC